MNRTELEQFKNKGFCYLKRKNNFFYKCVITNVSDTSVSIVDRFGYNATFLNDDVIEIAQWKERQG